MPDKTARQIATQIGCTNSDVGTIRNQVQTTTHLDLPPPVNGKDGNAIFASLSPPDVFSCERARRW